MTKRSLALLLLSFVSWTAASAEPLRASVTVRTDQPGSVIDPGIYGQFAEHLGSGIYEGIWVGENSPIANTRGLRNDVVAALKELGVPVLRWPGGCFADEYHWRDGIGPRDQRPTRINTTWGGVVDDNAFGTHEFMDFAELIGAEVYVNGNVGTGSAREMAEWVEYMTADNNSTLAQLRRANGRDKPWRLHYFAVGNETWGCGGNMRPEFYADLYRQYATFIKTPRDNRPQHIASGANGSNTEWTEVLMREAGKNMDAISVHYYTLPRGAWKEKGAATGFPEAEWISTFKRTLRMDEILTNHGKIMDRYDPEKRVSLLVDEWGTWYDVEPGTNEGFLYQQNSLRDALVAAVNFNIFHRHADRVRMTNIAQMVNVLQAMILTDGPKMVKTPTYHAFAMYKPFRGATHVPVEISTADYQLGSESVPAVHATAARDKTGALHIALANLDPQRAASVELRMPNQVFKALQGQILTASKTDAINTFNAPDTVRPAAFTVPKARGERLQIEVPAKSLLVLSQR
ncbi:alpha-N-arabinofuranosidase [Steroidobacter cummioxidans]|uniref:alpha-N-arabinofuranosidase n=1 Tax=Steroidobacter cummioxidans TaxID=1803913 RepID=UPI000E31529A|nr:alpha-L-arabinofuranosidase C-terminal domain-containing protein [Steroidobacter cummioxidans]